MSKITKNWKIKPVNTELYHQFLQRGIPRQTAYLLAIKNIKHPQKFLTPMQQKEFDPMLFKDMAKVVARINQAAVNHERVLVYGDYDTDGVTSSALMNAMLDSLGIDHDCFLPTRADGYGPQMSTYQPLVEHAEKEGRPYTLWITVDNGIQGKDEIEYLKQHYIDCIVTDHHLVKEEKIPDAYAIIHPAMPDSGYPEAILSGAGVAYKVFEAVNYPASQNYIDLAAIGIVGDVMDLTSENRIIVKHGLAKLQQGNGNLGITSLIQANPYADLSTLTSTDLSFNVVPALNACGRLKTPMLAYQLVTADNQAEAQDLAKKLLDVNNQRKEISSNYSQMALTQVDPTNKCNIIRFPYGTLAGIAGLIANQVMSATGKPTIVLVDHEDGINASGSARSLEGLDLENILEELKPNLVDFVAGHAQACAVKVKLENLPYLQTALNERCHEVKPAPLQIDCQVIPSQLAQFEKAAEQLEPFGKGNPEFEVLTQLKVGTFRHLGADGSTIKMTDARYPETEFMGFKDFKNVDFQPGDIVNVVGKVHLHIWKEHVNVQFIIDDFEVVNHA